MIINKDKRYLVNSVTHSKTFDPSFALVSINKAAYSCKKIIFDEVNTTTVFIFSLPIFNLKSLKQLQLISKQIVRMGFYGQGAVVMFFI